MFHAYRAAALLILSLVFATSAFAQDRIVMKNGDVITGNVSLIDGDDVFIEPSYADTFAVDLAEVETIELEEAFEVELADETRSDAATQSSPSPVLEGTTPVWTQALIRSCHFRPGWAISPTGPNSSR